MAKRETPTLTAKKRSRLGTRYARRERQTGLLPAVLYGRGEPPVAITLETKEALLHINSGARVFNMRVEGASGAATALLKDIQFDYLGSRVIHVDFARVDLNQTVQVNVHVSLKGDAKGLKTAGAVLLHPMMEVAVKCRVTDIVDHIDVDISDLDVGQARHASDVVLPPGFELVTQGSAVLATIQIKAEEVAPEQAVVEGEGQQPEVITERKAEGEAGEGEKAEKGEKGEKKKEKGKE